MGLPSEQPFLRTTDSFMKIQAISNLVFTVGHTVSYERYFSEQDTPKKLGRTNSYEGGSVWQTEVDAQKHCPRGYSVYGVKARWGLDTAPSADGDWHDLLVTSDLIKLYNQP